MKDEHISVQISLLTGVGNRVQGPDLICGGICDSI